MRRGNWKLSHRSKLVEYEMNIYIKFQEVMPAPCTVCVPSYVLGTPAGK